MFRVRSSLAQDFEQTLFCPHGRPPQGRLDPARKPRGGRADDD